MVKKTLFNLHLNNDAAYKKMVYHSCNLRLRVLKRYSLHMFALYYYQILLESGCLSFVFGPRNVLSDRKERLMV